MKQPRPPAAHPLRGLRLVRSPLYGAAAVATLAQLGSAQITISIDWKSRSVSLPSSPPQSQPLTEGDLLRPGPGALKVPPAPPPQRPIVALSGGDLGLVNYAACLGHSPGTPCGIEIDSFSGGHDAELLPGQAAGVGDRRRLWFSVDEWATGHPGTLTTPQHATVRNQGAPGVPAPVFEACADVFVDTNLPSGPLGPVGAVPNNVGALDGNGLPSSNGFVYPGLGLIEPNAPNTPPPPYNGDNLDALEIGTVFGVGSLVYLSLDSAFLDPLNQVQNSGTAQANGFRGGDVLKIIAGGGTTLQMYAPAAVLGLDQAGPDTDDLDALILLDNGDAIYQPSHVPYDWTNGSTDMLVFSVRRGSQVVGMPDSIFNVPIEEGDLLVPPVAGGNGNPGILYAAERLGLRTARSFPGVQFGDDLDAADVTKVPYFDCNENGQEDSVDIATGFSADANKNGIPDECDDGVVEYCDCAAAIAPCSNGDPNAGCANSSGLGGLLLSNVGGGGSTSVTADDLVFQTTQVPPNVSGIFFMGANTKPPTPFEDGLRCIGSPVFRFGVQNAGSAATFQLGPGTCALALARFGVAGQIDAGETWRFQTWYRDPTGPCSQGSNLSNAIKVTYEP
jgi:hypothetical protein